MVKAVFLCDSPDNVARVYAAGRRERVAAITDVVPGIVSSALLREGGVDLSGVEVVWSTWGMPVLGDQDFAALPDLKAVFYAAGSVRRFAEPLLCRGIRLVSAWQANAVPVAEYTLAQVLLANKMFLQNAAESSHSAERRARVVRGMPGNFGETVALLGAGAIGRKVIELLRPFNLRVIVWDPFLSQAGARELGVEKADSLEEAFARGFTVSNHLANVPETVGLIREEHFRVMRDHATFINTGRGATVDEPGMARVLAERRDLVALLDVTRPEPPVADSPLYRLPNVTMTSHIAGSIGDEVVRMADYVIEEFAAWRDGRPLRYEVTPEMLATMA